MVRENGKTVCFGAAINSSVKELDFALADPSPNRIAFDLERVMLSDFWIYDLQNTYFVLDSVNQLQQIARTDFDAIIPKLLAKNKIGLGSVCETDKVLSLGTGAYHAEYFALDEPA